MFLRAEDAKIKDINGIEMHVLANGKKSMVVEFHLLKAQSVPTHSHPNEQTGYVVSGKLELNIADEVLTLGPGDSYNIPEGVEHSGVALEESIVLDYFTPLRESYL